MSTLVPEVTNTYRMGHFLEMRGLAIRVLRVIPFTVIPYAQM